MNKPENVAEFHFASLDDMSDWVNEHLGTVHCNNVKFFCTPDEPRAALCVVTTEGRALNEIHARLGGETIGFDTVAVSLPLGKGFSCPRRGAGQTLDEDCECRCRVVRAHHAPAGAWRPRRGRA